MNQNLPTMTLRTNKIIDNGIILTLNGNMKLMFQCFEESMKDKGLIIKFLDEI